jgi:hypothetical protein
MRTCRVAVVQQVDRLFGICITLVLLVLIKEVQKNALMQETQNATATYVVSLNHTKFGKTLHVSFFVPVNVYSRTDDYTDGVRVFVFENAYFVCHQLRNELSGRV